MKYKNIAGADVVERGLKNLTPELAREVAAAINKGGEEVRDRAKAIAPRGRTGRLRRAIQVLPIQQLNKQRRFGVRVGVFPRETARGRAAFYARFVEFGTRPRRTATGGHPGTAPRPFLFPAYWSLRKRVRSRISNATRKAAKAAFRG